MGGPPRLAARSGLRHKGGPPRRSRHAGRHPCPPPRHAAAGAAPVKRPREQRKGHGDELPPLDPADQKPSGSAPIIVTVLILFGLTAVGFIMFDLRFQDIGHVWLLLPLLGLLFYAVWRVVNR